MSLVRERSGRARRLRVTDLLCHGQDGDGDRRCVGSPLGLGLGHALHPMHARLELEAAEHAPARDTGARFLRVAYEARPGHGVAERLSARMGAVQ